MIAFVIADQALRPCDQHDAPDSSGNVTNCGMETDGRCSRDAACLTEFLRDFIGWVREHPAVGSVLLAVVFAVGCVCFVPGSVLTLGAGAAFAAALGGLHRRGSISY